jgi:quercetin 2,3-dioxygenase
MDWYLMVGPEDSNAPLYVRQNVYIYDAHPREGDELQLPFAGRYQPFLYVVDGEISVEDDTIHKYEAVTDMERMLPTIRVKTDATLVLFLVDMDTPMSMKGTISGERG